MGEHDGPPHVKLLFFGWGAAAAAALRSLGDLPGKPFQVQCVSGHAQAQDCDLTEVCAALGFNCLLTDDDQEVLKTATAFAASLIMSVSYRRRIRNEVLALCQTNLNFHPSLLPKHRGCMSGFWTILDGDTETGVTCHRMVEGFDEGRVIHQERLPVEPSHTSFSLYNDLLPVTAVCFRRVVEMFLAGKLPEGIDQRSLEGASYHYRKLPYDGQIQADWPEDKIERFIRAMHFPPFEGAVLMTDDGRRVVLDTFEDYLRLKREAPQPVGASPVSAALAC